MFVPISDDNPLRQIRVQWVTIGLIIINVVVFALQTTPQGAMYASSFAVVPRELFSVGIFGGPAMGPYDSVAIPEPLTLLTYMFLHGDFWHLTGNMLFLWVFGDNVEDAVGHVKFIIFYLLCGIVAALFHAGIIDIWTPEGSTSALIGASGAVAGVISAYLLLHPQVRVWIVAFRIIPLHISAAWALGAWIVSQFVMVVLPSAGPVAWWAHIGGIIAGAVLIVFMRRSGVPLLQRIATV